jgi:hypothetical protein
MIRKIYILPVLVAVFVSSLFLSTGTVFADPWAPGQPSQPVQPPVPGTVPISNGTPVTPAPVPISTDNGQVVLPPVRLMNPLKVKTIEELLNLILDIVILLAAPVIVFFIIYSGFLYVTARGKPEQIKTATNALTWTIVGALIILGAKILLTIVTGTVNSLR